MGNRTFIIMLSACIMQVLVVGGTVTYVALRDSGATQAVEADLAHASEDHAANDDNITSEDDSHGYGDSSGQDHDNRDDREPTGDYAPAGPTYPAAGQSGSYY